MRYAVEVLERRLCHAGFLTLASYRLRHSLYGGGWSAVIERDLFCARIDASQAAGVHGAADEGEETRVLVLDAVHAIAGIGAGRLDTMPVIIALQWLALHRQRLRTGLGPPPMA
jgi:hypothetical protein